MQELRENLQNFVDAELGGAAPIVGAALLGKSYTELQDLHSRMQHKENESQIVALRALARLPAVKGMTLTQ